VLPNTGNILDQLLGGFDIAATGAPAQIGQGAGGELFGSILAGALGAGINSVGEESLTQPQMLGIPLTAFGQVLVIHDPQAPLDSSIARDGETSAALENAGPGWLEASAPATTIGQPAVSSKASTAVESDPALEFSISNQQLRSMLANAQLKQGGTLEIGAYQVVDWEMSGDQLELTLVSERNTAPIQVSIPSVSLESAVVKSFDQTSDSQRVPLLDQTSSEADQLSRLLRDLKLRTLEVKLESSSASRGEANGPVEVRLVAEKSGHEVVIRTGIIAQQLKVSTPSDTERKTGDPLNLADVDAESDGDCPVQAKSITASNPLLDQVDARAARLRLSSSQFDLPERLNLRTQNTLSQSAAGGDGVLGKFPDANSATADRAQAPVRLTVPESAIQQLRPNGQSIMLKIEPEHLGPARLNLTLNHQTLTARVTVDSPAAKVVVEHSLDQLNSQLSKAGIQVDRLEVALSGGGAQERFFERRPQWSQESVNRYGASDDDTEMEIRRPEPINVRSARQYVNAGGVNLWA